MKDKGMYSKTISVALCCLAVWIALAVSLGTHALAQTPPNVKDFPTIKKNPELPSGSEATALTILLNYHGVQVTKETIGEKLPRESLPIDVNERLVGGDPNRAYIGDPFTEEGLGSYQQPIARILREYPSIGQVIDRTGQPFLSILAEVERGNPMMVWVTEEMKPASLTQFWWTADNHLIQWHGNQNPVVLFDYDETNVYISNPSTGSIEAYNRLIFERIWKDVRSRAIGIDASTPAPSSSINQTDSNDIPSLNESFDYAEERRKLLKEIERKRDPNSNQEESLKDSDGATGKRSISTLGIVVIIISAIILLASLTTLLIVTLKGKKEKQEQPQKPLPEEEDQ